MYICAKTDGFTLGGTFINSSNRKEILIVILGQLKRRNINETN